MNRFPALAFLALPLLFLPAVPASDPEKGEKIATFSIAAVDPETGVCGGAVASLFPAVGKVVVHARADVGVLCTQHYDVRAWGTPALDRLGEGKLAEEVMVEILRKDKQPGQRQLAIVDMKGNSAQHHPIDAGKGSWYWGGASGKYFVCQGNTLNGRDVITAMAKAYEETKGSLADRLMASLIAGDCAGGDHRGRLAAGIRVCKKGVEGYWLDLHVDKSTDAVLDLAKNYAELKHDCKGEWTGGQLPFMNPCPNRPKPQRPNP